MWKRTLPLGITKVLRNLSWHFGKATGSSASSSSSGPGVEVGHDPTTGEVPEFSDPSLSVYWSILIDSDRFWFCSIPPFVHLVTLRMVLGRQLPARRDQGLRSLAGLEALEAGTSLVLWESSSLVCLEPPSQQVSTILNAVSQTVF